MAFLDNEGLKRFWENLALKLSNKVDKVEGKGLSTNDYTTTEKAKLASAVTEEIFNEEISKRPTAYDTRKTEPLTIEWDGVIGEREWFVMDEDIDRATLAVKVSDATPSYQEIMAGTILTNTKTEEIPVEQFQTMAFGSSTVAFGENDEGFFCVVDPADLAEEEERFTHGLWLTIQDDRVENKTFVTRLFLPSVATGERKTLDPKYLPDTVVTQEVFNEEINKRPIAYDTRKTEELTIEWDGEIGERNTVL